ncbi:MAG: MFS transporter [Erysipelotrichaceae bacterium]|nr:MFS transporter [Erysipelotrichaceae bacterium]
MKTLFRKLNQLKAFRDLNEEEFSWVLYDVGNSAFTMLACSLVPIWFHSLADSIIGENAAFSKFQYITAIITAIVAVIGPACGAITDTKDLKKPVFTVALFGGLIGCVIMGASSNWTVFYIVYIIAKVAYSCSLTFYDSMLNDVTTEDRMDSVSSYGYAWGYIGSCIPFLIALIIYILGGGLSDSLMLFSPRMARFLGCVVTAGWWLLVTVPLLTHYKQKFYADTHGAVRDTFKRLWKTIAEIFTQDKKVFVFLIAYFLYIDGVNTIIDSCMNIVTAIMPGQDTTVIAVIFLLGTQVVAFAFSLVFAKLSKKYDTVPLLLICISGYFAVAVYALWLQKIWQFGIMAFGVGMFQGSIQSLSRSYFSKIIPAEKSGEYFGIYDIFCKGAAFLGAWLLGFVQELTNSIQMAVGALAIFFAIGFILLKIADKIPQSEASLRK